MGLYTNGGGGLPSSEELARRNAVPKDDPAPKSAEPDGGDTEGSKHAKGGGSGIGAYTALVWIRDVAITGVVVILLFMFYAGFVTNWKTLAEQNGLKNDLFASWKTETVSPAKKDGGLSYRTDVELVDVPKGKPMAHVSIPALDVDFTMVSGVRQSDLSKGPGHYPDSALPGERGNTAIAGHRFGHAGPFRYLDQLEACDEITIETGATVRTYSVLSLDGGAAPECVTDEDTRRELEAYPELPGRQIIKPTDVGVVDPVPHVEQDRASIAPENQAPLLTLTTCHPEYGNTERMVVHAVLTSEEAK